jgi:hypothetical protein
MKALRLSQKEEQLARKGERIYRSKLRALLEARYHGMFVAIEVESGDYFLGEEMAEALEKAQEKHPKKLFHVVRIGYPAASSFKHRFTL